LLEGLSTAINIDTCQTPNTSYIIRVSTDDIAS
jgi:hypothetical protein